MVPQALIAPYLRISALHQPVLADMTSYNFPSSSSKAQDVGLPIILEPEDESNQRSHGNSTGATTSVRDDSMKPRYVGSIC